MLNEERAETASASLIQPSAFRRLATDYWLLVIGYWILTSDL
jgi:hypothetical protein